MIVRPLRPLDVVALASLRQPADSVELTARQWPRTESASGGLSMSLLLGAALANPPAGRRGWIATEGDHLRGCVLARPRSAGLVLDVERLFVDREHDQVGAELLEAVGSYAAQRGFRRLFVNGQPLDAMAVTARRGGLERYQRSTVYRLARGFTVEHSDLFQARPRRRVDDQSLFQLYTATVPAPVRAAEAMTLEEWQGLTARSFGGLGERIGRRQYVWELGAEVVGWLSIWRGRHSQYAELLIHPRFEDASDRFLRFTLAQASRESHVYLAPREHQTALARAAERFGFEPVCDIESYVRLLAQRVPQPLLAPAKMVRV